jgi:hypothetical protein
MMSDWELWACANHYIAKHHADAAIHAAMRADELLAEGDLEGARNLQGILRRISQLIDPPTAGVN